MGGCCPCSTKSSGHQAILSGLEEPGVSWGAAEQVMLENPGPWAWQELDRGQRLARRSVCSGSL